MRADTRSGRAKAIAAFLCPSAESEPSLNGSLLSQIQLASSFSYIVFSGSDHSVSVVRWCKNMWYVCVWNKTDRVADFPWNIRKNHWQEYFLYPYVCLKVENHPALLIVSSMVFLSPRSTNTTEEQPDGKNVQLPYLYIRAVYKNPVLSGVLVCAWRSTATTARMDGIFSTADFQNKTNRTIW